MDKTGWEVLAAYWWATSALANYRVRMLAMDVAGKLEMNTVCVGELLECCDNRVIWEIEP